MLLLVHQGTTCSTLSTEAPCAPLHPSKHHVLHCSVKAPCAPPHPSGHHKLHCSIEAPRDTSPKGHSSFIHPTIRGSRRPPTCPPNSGMTLCSTAGPSGQICWCSGSWSPKFMATDGCQPPASVQRPEFRRMRKMSLFLCMFLIMTTFPAFWREALELPQGVGTSYLLLTPACWDRRRSRSPVCSP